MFLHPTIGASIGGGERPLAARVKANKDLLQVASLIASFLGNGQVEKPMLDPGLRRELLKILEPDMNQFRAFTGRQFEAWSV